MNQPSLDILVREIEATPTEHWAELLTQLRQFREHVAQQPVSNQATILETIKQFRNQQSEFLAAAEIDRQMAEERDAWDKEVCQLDARFMLNRWYGSTFCFVERLSQVSISGITY
jgi:hypothetical protein